MLWGLFQQPKRYGPFAWSNGEPCFFRVTPRQVPDTFLGWSYLATVPLKSKLDLPHASARLSGDQVASWFREQQNKGICFDPDPWEKWLKEPTI